MRSNHWLVQWAHARLKRMVGCELVRVSHNAPRPTARMRKGNDLDTSNSDCSVDHASRRLALGPLSRAGTYSLSVPKLVLGPDGPVHKTTAYNPMGEQAACVARQYFYAENTAAYTGEVFGRPDKGATSGVVSSPALPTKVPRNSPERPPI